MTDDKAESRNLAPRLLFVPVSGPFGMGEYARSLAIAQAARSWWPGASIHFILSREASYAAATPFPATFLPASPTLHSPQVIEVLNRFRPDVVIFDNAGRTAQLRHAKRLGARLVYISSRRRQRGKAFRLRWMRLLDEHWIAYPEVLAGKFGFIEHLKLRVLRRPTVRYLDVVLSPASPGRCVQLGPGMPLGRCVQLGPGVPLVQYPSSESIVSQLGWGAGNFVLLVPGGGTGHPGAADAISEFSAAARTLAAEAVATVLVGVANEGERATDDQRHDNNLAYLKKIARIPQSDLAQLMSAAQLVVTNGGSTLVQALYCGKACIAVAIAQDQGERIKRCVQAKVVIAAPPTAAGIVNAVSSLLRNPLERRALAARAAALGLVDGVGIAIGALVSLLASSA